MSAGVTERELRDINLELTRQKLQLELLLLRHDINRFGINLKMSYIDEVKAARHKLSSGRLIQKRRLDEMLEQLGAIRCLNLVLVHFWNRVKNRCETDGVGRDGGLNFGKVTMLGSF